MYYFFTNLTIHSIICLILIVVMIIFTDRNFKRKTKFVVSYFIPVLMLILIGLDVIRYLAPRLLDISNVIGNVTYTYTGQIESVSQFNNYFVVDGTTYFINPVKDDLEVGRTVRVRYTPVSNYAVSVSYNLDAKDEE